jgi:asparagine synthase (glutamine-hydrolysing)
MTRLRALLDDAPAGAARRRLEAMARAAGSAAAKAARLGPAALAAPALATTPGGAVALEGWIFNAAELGGAGDDARLFLSLYEREGMAKALSRLNGDFALTLFDRASGTLYAARDRFGLKPLYYCRHDGGWAVSARPRALLSLPGVSAEPSRRYVGLFAGSHYRTFDNAPEESPFRDIRQLPAGCWLELRGGESKVRRYWSLEEAPELTDPEDALAEQYRALLADAVRLRVARATRPAFTLSGGMDSSSVLGSAAKAAGKRLTAISTTYLDPTYDESEEIRSMLASTVEEWIPVQVGDPDVFALLPEIIDHHDEPVATATWLSHYLLCREASSRGFGALFGGLGGDELNAGEYEHFFYFFADLKAAGEEARLAEEIRMWTQYHDHPVHRKSPALAASHVARVTDPAAPGVCLPDRGRIGRYAAAVRRDYFDVGAYVPEMEHPFRSYLKNRCYQDLMRETVPCCLRAEDRQTAAFGLGNFLPFLDHRLVEFMFRVPTALKYDAGVSKRLLRLAMRGVLPEETRTRVKKTGWNAPAHRWFSGPGREKLFDLVRSRSFRERGIYVLAEVERLINEHDEILRQGLATDNHMMFLWQLVNLELWQLQIRGWSKGT